MKASSPTNTTPVRVRNGAELRKELEQLDGAKDKVNDLVHHGIAA